MAKIYSSKNSICDLWWPWFDLGLTLKWDWAWIMLHALHESKQSLTPSCKWCSNYSILSPFLWYQKLNLLWYVRTDANAFPQRSLPLYQFLTSFLCLRMKKLLNLVFVRRDNRYSRNLACKLAFSSKPFITSWCHVVTSLSPVTMKLRKGV